MIVSKENCQKSSKNLMGKAGMAPARGKLTAKLLLLEGRFNQTPGAPYAKTASGPADQHIRMANRPDRHHATANQRPGAQTQQHIPATIVSACCLQPFTTTGGKIQPLLLDLAKQLRLTSFTFDFTALGTFLFAVVVCLLTHGACGAAT